MLACRRLFLSAIESQNYREYYGPVMGGFQRKEPYPVNRIPFEPGDTLLVFSDGFIEARKDEETEYGYDRLLEICRQGKQNPQELVKKILEDVNKFLDGKPLQDDATLLAFQRRK